MGIANEVGAGGGTRCFGANVSITASAAMKVVSRMFVVVEPAGAEPDAPYKAIVFDDLTAISVMCVSLEDVDRLRQWSIAGIARLIMADPITVTAEVARIITCPPPELLPEPDTSVPVRITDPRLDVSQKLDSLTAWGREWFANPLTAVPAHAPTAA